MRREASSVLRLLAILIVCISGAMRSTTAFLARQTFRPSHSLYIQRTYSIVGSHASQYQGTIKACGVLPFWRRVETVRHYAHHTVDKRTNLSAQSQPGNDKEVISESSKEKTAWSSHESSSEFITHYLEPKHTKRTVRDAISSILAKDTQKLDGTILNSDLEALVKEGAIIDSSLWHDPGKFPAADSSVKQVLSPHQLLGLGSIWFLPASAPRDPALGGKTIRLTVLDANRVLEEDDYLRIHHTPRRFTVTSGHDWGRNIDADGVGVIVARDDDLGYIVIDKPAGVPVHSTVDNTLENVSAAIGRSLLAQKMRVMKDKQSTQDPSNGSIGSNHPNSDPKRGGQRRRRKQKVEPFVYVTTPQRLDQNTSGLLVVSTKKTFAAYFAQLLRFKTDQQLIAGSAELQKGSETSETEGSAIHKAYKCLVCISPKEQHEQHQQQQTNDGPTTSMVTEVNRLIEYVSSKAIIRHYLEPSIRAPKTFLSAPRDDSWQECLLRITHVGDVCPIIGSDASLALSRSLWIDDESVPTGCVAVAEIEVELLTGRTHQIRGQLSTDGFSLVGDTQYGGAIPQSAKHTVGSTEATPQTIDSELMALQCCQLDFLAPRQIQKRDGRKTLVPSDTWKSVRLNSTWWTPHLKQYQLATSLSSSCGTTSQADMELVNKLGERVILPKEEDTDTSPNSETSSLPPQVILSPGVHKYVLIEARVDKDDKWLTFVKSASPAECGGMYHANVAEELVHKLTDAGFMCKVLGGGRIEYNPDVPHAHVYGFSYGFGKGDHAKAASLIEGWTKGRIVATFDNSNALY